MRRCRNGQACTNAFCGFAHPDTWPHHGAQASQADAGEAQPSNEAPNRNRRQQQRRVASPFVDEYGVTWIPGSLARNRRCRNGANCTRVNCGFAHPESWHGHRDSQPATQAPIAIGQAATGSSSTAAVGGALQHTQPHHPVQHSMQHQPLAPYGGQRAGEHVPSHVHPRPQPQPHAHDQGGQHQQRQVQEQQLPTRPHSDHQQRFRNTVKPSLHFPQSQKMSSSQPGGAPHGARRAPQQQRNGSNQLQHFRKLVLSLQVKDPDSAQLANALTNLGRCLQAEGAFEEALEHHQEALRIREQLPDRPAQALQPQPQSSTGVSGPLAGGAQGSSAPTTTHVPPPIALSLNMVANTLQSMGRLDDALKAHQRALRVAEAAAPSSLSVAHTLNQMADVLEALGNTDQALQNHLRALEIREQWESGGRRLGMVKTLKRIAELLRSQGRTEEATGYAQRASSIQQDAKAQRGQHGRNRSKDMGTHEANSYKAVLAKGAGAAAQSKTAEGLTSSLHGGLQQATSSHASLVERVKATNDAWVGWLKTSGRYSAPSQTDPKQYPVEVLQQFLNDAGGDGPLSRWFILVCRVLSGRSTASRWTTRHAQLPGGERADGKGSPPAQPKQAETVDHPRPIHAPAASAPAAEPSHYEFLVGVVQRHNDAWKLWLQSTGYGDAAFVDPSQCSVAILQEFHDHIARGEPPLEGDLGVPRTASRPPSTTWMPQTRSVVAMGSEWQQQQGMSLDVGATVGVGGWGSIGVPVVGSGSGSQSGDGVELDLAQWMGSVLREQHGHGD